MWMQSDTSAHHLENMGASEEEVGLWLEHGALERIWHQLSLPLRERMLEQQHQRFRTATENATRFDVRAFDQVMAGLNKWSHMSLRQQTLMLNRYFPAEYKSTNKFKYNYFVHKTQFQTSACFFIGSLHNSLHRTWQRILMMAALFNQLYCSNIACWQTSNGADFCGGCCDRLQLLRNKCVLCKGSGEAGESNCAGELLGYCTACMRLEDDVSSGFM